MKLKNPLAVYFLCPILWAQPIEIPEHTYFAGMKLNLSQALRAEIQRQVLEITKNKTYFLAKVNKADVHFPLIEKAFTEEDIPHDFKYLVIQESSLQADAVSPSNAVGYWQFKRESAEEVGLTISAEVDERKHILEASRGAARYLKKNYLMLTNWVYALIAYNTGLGGVKPYIENKYVGALEMDLDKELHWYAIKFLAYKFAYEDKVGYNKFPEIYLLEYRNNLGGKTLQELSIETGVSEEKLKEYNKWLLSKHIPKDKEYTLILAVTYLEKDQIAARLGIDLQEKPKPSEEVMDPQQLIKPQVEQVQPSGVPLFVTANGLRAIYARKSDNVASLAFEGGISIDQFIRYNDMQKFEEVQEGKIYYLESKNNRGIILYHTAVAGETMWDIAQKYGIKLKQLLRKNRMEASDALQAGRLIYLKYKRPDNEPVILASKPAAADNPKGTDESTQYAPVPYAVNTTKESTQTSQKITNVDTLSGVKKDQKTQELTPKSDSIARHNLVYTTAAPTNSAKNWGVKTKLPDSAYVYHVVMMQQTLYAISKHYGTKLDTLRAWNNIGADGIKYDQLLLVKKEPTNLTHDYLTYVVKAGQDIYSVASDIGVPTEKLLIWNNKKGVPVLAGEIIKYVKP